MQPDEIPDGLRGPLSGKLLEGRYQIQELLGAGGMGAVYRAHHTLMDKPIAFKVLLPEYSSQEEIVKRFQQEAQSASRLDHSSIIQVFDFGQTEDGMLFLVMEYLEGQSLTDLLENGQALPVDRALHIGQQICDALAHAHELGVVHRDLKPDNVMLVRKGGTEDVVKLLDFGIAKITQGESAAKGQTKAGMVFGTPEYMSPEQGAGDPVDHRADLYSVGVMLYHMLAGHLPFQAETNLEYIVKHINEPPRSLRASPAGQTVPDALDHLVLHALAKKPAERFQSAGELLGALAALDPRTSQPRLSSGALPPVTDPAVPLPGGTPTPSVTGPMSSVTGPVPTVGGAPPTAAEVAKHRRILYWGLGIGGVLLVTLIVLLAVLLGSEDKGDKKDKPDTAGADMGGESSRPLSLQVAHIRRLIEAKKLTEAGQALQELADRHPRSPQVHVLRGHLRFRQKKVDDCLTSYRDAARRDPEALQNETLLQNLAKLLKWQKGHRWGQKTRGAAIDLVDRYLSRVKKLDVDAVRTLTHYVNEWWEARSIWKAIGVLQRHKADQSVDYLHAYKQRFRSERDCDKRKGYIREMVTRDDKRFLPLLERIVLWKSFRLPYSKATVKNKCIKDEARKAIVALGGKVPTGEGTRGRKGKKGGSSVVRKVDGFFRNLAR